MNKIKKWQMEPITTRIRKYFSTKYSYVVIISQADGNVSSNKFLVIFSRLSFEHLLIKPEEICP